MEGLVTDVVAPRPGWRGRRVLVTGAAGFLGTWLTQALVDSGARVVCLVRDEEPETLFFLAGLDRCVTLVRGSVTDYFLLERVLRQYEIDTVFHLAAAAIVGRAVESPLSAFESNIRGTWHVLEAVRRTPTVRRLVVASSDKAYGAQPTLPYTEESPLQGRAPYDVSKSCADLLAQSYGYTYGLPVAITRCANLYGPGDFNWSRLIPGTIRSMFLGEAPIIRSDGHFTRDYLYIADAVDAYLLLAERAEEPGVKGHAFNFGPGQAISVLELVRRLLALGPDPSLVPRVLNEAKDEIRDQSLASEKARRVLGWQPRWALQDGVARTVQWYHGYFQDRLPDQVAASS